MIKTRREPKDQGGPPYECCCFCRTPTPYWTVGLGRKGGEQVACCQECAKTREPSEVPTKREWCDKERAIYKREHPHAPR
jgi:hypothetical protein